MKRVICVLLCVLTLAFCMTACQKAQPVQDGAEGNVPTVDAGNDMSSNGEKVSVEQDGNLNDKFNNIKVCVNGQQINTFKDITVEDFLAKTNVEVDENNNGRSLEHRPDFVYLIHNGKSVGYLSVQYKDVKDDYKKAVVKGITSVRGDGHDNSLIEINGVSYNNDANLTWSDFLESFNICNVNSPTKVLDLKHSTCMLWNSDEQNHIQKQDAFYIEVEELGNQKDWDMKVTLPASSSANPERKLFVSYYSSSHDSQNGNIMAIDYTLDYSV